MKIKKFNQKDYEDALQEFAKLLKSHEIKKIPKVSYEDIVASTGFPIVQRVYTKIASCEHEKTTIVIESDENGNKSQKTICSNCGKLLPKEDINEESVI